ncbi:MAG: LPS export ABC transporter periplasmic protein LptC [Cyanobacteria bacterium P01_A01_bin.45]
MKRYQYNQNHQIKKILKKRRITNFSSFPDLNVAKIICLLGLSFTLCLISVGCSGQNNVEDDIPDIEEPSAEDKESKLSFSDVTLEQADENGKPVWKVKAKKAKYTRERQLAEVENPFGELFQDGKVVYNVQADKADIIQDGKQLFLKGKIVATDPENGVVLRGNELEWRPQEDLLIVRNQINGTHKQLQATAKEARVKTREQKVDFSGGVIAQSVEPQLKMRTEHLIWKIKEEILIGDRPMQIDRYKNNQITDRGRGDITEINLKTKIARITKNGQIDLREPPMRIASNSMTWNLNTETVITNAPVKAVHQADNITVTANRGRLQIPQRVVYLTGKVNAIGQNKQSIQSQKLTWNLNGQTVDAQGSVVYKQQNPPLTLNGQTASGNLKAETIVVKGGGSSKNRVVTEIVPQIPN